MDYQTDHELGLKIHKILIEKHVETPVDIRALEHPQRFNNIVRDVTNLLNHVGFDLMNDSMRESPLRIAKMFVNELFVGLDYKNFPKCSVDDIKHWQHNKNTENLVSLPVNVYNISFSSLCEHHLQAIKGKVHIMYVPHNKLLGLSKFNRIVEFFARRPQLQERFTLQLQYALEFILETQVYIVVDAEHNCVHCRGVNDIQTHTRTISHTNFKENDQYLFTSFLNGIKK